MYKLSIEGLELSDSLKPSSEGVREVRGGGILFRLDQITQFLGCLLDCSSIVAQECIAQLDYKMALVPYFFFCHFFSLL